MQHVDYLFIYEVKAREMESILLLRYELEKRGYTVAFVNSWYSIFHEPPKIKTKVLVISAGYNTDVIHYFAGLSAGFDAIVNLQWEQILSKDNQCGDNSVYRIGGLALKIIHLCWGEENRNFLVKECNLPDSNAYITGSVVLDFVRQSFDGYYLRKHELLPQYGINPKELCVLFISSFTLGDLPREEYERVNVGNDTALHIECEIETKGIILEWFTKAAFENPTVQFIYRPHPAENLGGDLKLLAERHNNFHVITDYPINQWIVAVDKIYTWYSSSIAQIYAAQKSCYILRPVKLLPHLDIPSYMGCSSIATEEGFLNSLSISDESDFPVSSDIFKGIYSIQDEPSYLRVIAVLEDVLLCQHKQDIVIHSFKRHCFWRRVKKNKIMRALYKAGPSQLLMFIAGHTSIPWRCLEKQRQKIKQRMQNPADKQIHEQYQQQKAQLNFVREQEIEEGLKRLERILG